MQSVARFGRHAVVITALSTAVAIISPAQTITTLFSFTSLDGEFPQAALVQATNGALYGTTPGGGLISGGFGTIFEITPGGKLTSLCAFRSAGCPDGELPFGGLVQGPQG
jgi:uncharacterized repeat protein (TIGR03803 family)